jgi:hypothetical protein
MVKTSRNRNSVKIVLDFTGVLRLLGNNSVIPFLAAAKKRHFYPSKLPALRADVDGLAQKSAKPFLLLSRRFLAAFSPLSRRGVQNLSILPVPACSRICRKRLFLRPSRPVPMFSANAPVQRRNVRFSGFRWGHARLCPESRTNRRHGRDGRDWRFGCAINLCFQ